MNKNFLSVLDAKTKSLNMNKRLTDDLEFAITYLLSNSTIQTFCNMISFDLYEMDFKTLTAVHKISLFQADKDKVLNITYLEIIYNLFYQVHKRKLKYPDSLGYDMFSVPKKIKYYIELNGYELDPTTNDNGYKLFKLIPSQGKQIIEQVVKKNKNEIITAEAKSFISFAKNQYQEKVLSLKKIIKTKDNIYDFNLEILDAEFSKNFISEIDKLSSMNLNNISKEDQLFIDQNIDRLFNTTILLTLLSK